MTSGGLSGGYLKYLQALLPVMRRDPRVTRLDVFMPARATVPDVGATRTWPARDGLAGYRVLRAELAALAPDVVFVPTARLLDCGGTPTVVMVRNMEPLSVPFGGNTWRESFRNLARARVARRACRRASRVIAVSRHVRDFVTRQWQVPADRVGLVYHGIEAVARPPAARSGPFEGLQPFVFTAGSIRPARGLEDLLRAGPALLRAHPGVRIVIAGRADASSRRYEARMRGLAEQLGIADAVVWCGHLSPGEMSAAFQRCAAFVMSSRAEACPNIALEAMSHGALIVSTRQAPMPEFFDRAARYYEPRDADGLASQLAHALGSTPAELLPARHAGIARAAAFTWAATSDATLTQLELAIAAGHRSNRHPRLTR